MDGMRIVALTTAYSLALAGCSGSGNQLDGPVTGLAYSSEMMPKEDVVYAVAEEFGQQLLRRLDDLAAK
jgi:hypothetical protein